MAISKFSTQGRKQPSATPHVDGGFRKARESLLSDRAEKHNPQSPRPKRPWRRRTPTNKNLSPVKCTLSQSARQFQRVDCQSSEFLRLCQRFLVAQSARGWTIRPATRRTVHRSTY